MQCVYPESVSVSVSSTFPVSVSVSAYYSIIAIFPSPSGHQCFFFHFGPPLPNPNSRSSYLGHQQKPQKLMKNIKIL